MNYKTVNDYEMLYLVSEDKDMSYDILCRKYLPIIKSVANKYFSFAKQRGAEYQDLIQEGYIGLNSAIVNYRSDLEVIFYTYASLCVERHIRTYCRSLSALKHQILNSSFPDDGYSSNIISDESYFGNFFKSSSRELLKKLFFSTYSFDLDTRCVFELRYNGFTYKEISILLDLSLSSVETKFSKARKNLKKVFENYNLN